MATNKKQPGLAGVSGGDEVSFLQLDHGLGRKRDFFEKLAAEAEAQGIVPTVAAPITKRTDDNNSGGESIAPDQLGQLQSGLSADANTDTSGTPRNAIDIPLQKLLLEQWERGLSQFYSTEDPMKREAQELADKVVQSALRELVSADAVLFVPPDEFSKVRKELQELAEQLVKDAQKLSDKSIKKLPVNEEALKRSLTRDLNARKFRDRHNALFHYSGIGKSAPETGIEPVAAISGSFGSVGPDHGRYRAKI